MIAEKLSSADYYFSNIRIVRFGNMPKKFYIIREIGIPILIIHLKILKEEYLKISSEKLSSAENNSRHIPFSLNT